MDDIGYVAGSVTGGSVGRASDSRFKDPRFEPRQEHKKKMCFSESKMLC